MTTRLPADWNGHFTVDTGLVFASLDVGDDWAEIRSELTAAFEMSRAAAVAGEPIVYVVHNDDLLGRRGPGRAMVATGLLSAARTAALELTKTGVPVNVLAIEDDTPPTTIGLWAMRLTEPGGPTGDLVHLGPGHLGKTPA